MDRQTIVEEDMSSWRELIRGSVEEGGRISDYEFWLSSGVLPGCISALSLVVLICQLLVSLIWKQNKKTVGSNVEDRAGDANSEETRRTASNLANKLRNCALKHGSAAIFAWKVIRLIGTLALSALTLAGVFQEKALNSYDHNVDQIALLAAYIYTSLLSLYDVLQPDMNAIHASTHLNLILLTSTAVYFYRDIWPLGTYTLKPLDESEGPLLWTRIGVLLFTSIVVQLVIPGRYNPIDPNNPQAETNGEQTASLLSFIYFTFMDSIVIEGYKNPHLSYEKLPPLCDYDRSEYIVGKGRKILYPWPNRPKRYLLWGLLQIFWKEYFFMISMGTVRALASLVSPLMLNRILIHIETAGRDATIRPWVYIVGLFLGRSVLSLSLQLYSYMSTRALIHTSAILTQIIFEHSLKIRITDNSDTSNSEIETNLGIQNTDQTSETTSVTLNSGEADVHAVRSNSTTEANYSAGSSTSTTTKQYEQTKGAEVKKGGSVVGKINNLIATDTQYILEGRDFILSIWYTPLQVIGCTYFLYRLLGWSALLGILVLVLLLPLPLIFARMMKNAQSKRMEQSDARVQHVTEVVSVIRMIKLFAWESKIKSQLSERRENELEWIRLQRYLEVTLACSNFVIPLAALLVTYSSYTLIMKRSLNAAVVFPSIALFEMMKQELYEIFQQVPFVIRAKVSVDRVDDFLRNSPLPLLDEFTSVEDVTNELYTTEDGGNGAHIGFSNATFSWDAGNTGVMTPSRRSFNLRIDGDLHFPEGKISLIVGPTGSGKTSLLYALLGEMHFRPSGPNSSFNLPRQDGVAYAAQESWVQNETFKENILFGSPLEVERYQKVLYQCGLLRDLELYKAGDETEVGELGVNLSGGQKARITLARAVYSSAKILLLDDVLAALDVHTAKWVVEKCLKGDLLRGRTVILVTHNIALTAPVAEFVVCMGPNGKVGTRGTVADAINHSPESAQDMQREVGSTVADEGNANKGGENAETDRDMGKLTVAEEISIGRVRWGAFRLFFYGMGGMLTWSFILLNDAGAASLNIGQVWYLGYWARQYETKPPTEVNVPYYLGMYTLIVGVSCVFWISAMVAYFLGTVRASRKIYEKLMDSLLGTTFRWFDTVPTSRIITRCTQDIAGVDGSLASELSHVMDYAMFMLFLVIGVTYIAPPFLVSSIATGILATLIARFYIKSQMSLKREMSNARSPVLGHFGAAIAGLTSLRAYGAQVTFCKGSLQRIDKYTRCARSYYNLNRWLGVRADMIGSLYSVGLALYLLYGKRAPDASNTGFGMNVALSFASSIIWFVRIWNNFEVESNHLERIADYIEIEQEPKPSESGMPPAYWPASGSLEVRNLCARYSSSGPEVLHGLSFDVKSGERIGVVGRTGSGKSTLTLALLRAVLTSGTVRYDGLDISKINLEALRLNVTIIPQQPELIFGTLRQNLDPFERSDDASLNAALAAAGLFSLQKENDEANLSLDSMVTGGGSNLSVGQRQILALARAIVRGSKLLILDEATSAIDYSTDKIIQTSIRHELRDVTLITIAHRLQTIMDANRVLVLSEGNLIEYDTPANLLRKQTSLFRSLVDESNDREKLYKMAFQGPQKDN